MATIPSLPTIDVYLAFNPTYSGTTLVESTTQALPASGDSNDYWTNVSQYVRDFDTQSGRQHFLDRVEASTLNMTVTNRDGFFFNGTLNGTGYVIQPRMPIAVTATWSGTTYPLFIGVTDSVQEQVTDEVNVDLAIQASDMLKYLSLCYMTRSAFWPGYAASTSTEAWYRLGSPVLAIVTNAVRVGTTATFTAQNSFASGDNVTITGLGITTGITLNLSNVTVATANAHQFTVTVASGHDSTSSGSGTAYRAIAIDQQGGTSGQYLGAVAWPTYGAMIYDPDTCVDLTNGSSVSTGYIRLPAFTSQGGLDFWVLGLELGSSVIASGIASTGSASVVLGCSSSGLFEIEVNSTIYTSSVQINDGYWHHIGVVGASSGVLHGYVDGQFFSIGGALTDWSATINLIIGSSAGSLLGGLAAYVDEIVVSNTSSLSTLATEVQNRYRAGTLLQLGFPTTPSTNSIMSALSYSNGIVPSGDRIAEILCLAGFGTVSGGTISAPSGVTLISDLYYINNGSAWAAGTAGNGFVGTEPWYWDTPVTTSTALDLIGQITDTDIGSFFQKPGGTLNFFNQLFYGTWAWTPSSSTGTWTPNTYTPTGDLVWTDDGSGYAYEGNTLQVMRDDADIWTMVLVTPQAGIEQIYEDTSAEGRWGYSTLTKTATVHTSLTLALSTATFLGYLFRSALPRVQAIELSSNTGNGGAVSAIIGAVLGDVVEFKRTSPNASTSGTYPDQMAQIDQNMVIESLALSFKSDAGELRASYQLDPFPIRS